MMIGHFAERLEDRVGELAVVEGSRSKRTPECGGATAR
jgi:hypothetical protein